MFTPITNHIADAKKRLLEWYKGVPGIEKIIESLLVGFQDLETAATDLNEDRDINNAVGILLDRLGTIVGLAREPGLGDEDYRTLLKSKISQNISQGEPERLIDVYKTLTQAVLVYLTEHFPAGFGLGSEVDPGTQEEADRLFRLIEGIAPAAVRFEDIVVFDGSEPFSFDGAISGLGYGSTTDLSLGGKYATLYTPYIEFAFDGGDSDAAGFGTVLDPLVGGCYVGL